MKILKNPVVIIGLLAVIGLVVWYFNSRRWIRFANDGDSNFACDFAYKGKTMFRMRDEDHGIAAGDTIEVDHESTFVPKGRMKVVETKSCVNGIWIVTDQPFTDYGGTVAGQLRKV